MNGIGGRVLKPSGLNRSAVRTYFEQHAGRLRGDDEAFVVREAGQRLLERLEPVRLESVAHVLDVGCGSGAQSAELARRFPHSRILGIDLAPGRVPVPLPPTTSSGLAGMVARARARLAGWAGDLTPSRGVDRGAVTAWCTADAHALPVRTSAIDVVWMSMSAQWFDDPITAIGEAFRVLRPGGLIAFSAPGPGSLLELRDVIGGAWPVWQDMHDWGDALVHAGFQAPVVESERITLEYSLVSETVDVGPGAPLRKDLAGWLPVVPAPDWSGDALAAAARRTLQGDGIAVDIELVFGHAWVPATKPRTDGFAPVQWVPRAPGASGSS